MLWANCQSTSELIAVTAAQPLTEAMHITEGSVLETGTDVDVGRVFIDGEINIIEADMHGHPGRCSFKSRRLSSANVFNVLLTLSQLVERLHRSR